MAVAEAALGRMGAGQLQRYTTGNAAGAARPDGVGAARARCPEIAPSPDFGANIDQAVHRAVDGAAGLGHLRHPVAGRALPARRLARTLGRGRVTVVPQVPSGQYRVAGRNVRLGIGRGRRERVPRRSGGCGPSYTRTGAWALTIGAVLPTGAHVASVRLDGHRHGYRVVSTARGREVLVSGGHGRGRTTCESPSADPVPPTRRECTKRLRRVGANARAS